MALLRVHPSDLAAASVGLDADGPALSGAARLLADGAREAAGALGDHGVLGAALGGWAAVEGTVSATLDEAVRSLSAALASAAAAYAVGEATAREELRSERRAVGVGEGA